MRKTKRAEVVLSILRLIETTRPPKKVYGYFTRRQLVELHTYLLLRKDDRKEIYTCLHTLRSLLHSKKQLSSEANTLVQRAMRLSSVRGD